MRAMVVLGSLFFLAACGSSGSSNGTSAAANNQCGVGTGWSSQYNTCLVVSPTNPSCGIINSSPNTCVPVTNAGTNPYVYGGGSLIWSGRMQITNSQNFQLFLQEYGLFCNQNSSWLGNFNIGYQNCSAWGNNATLIITLASAILPAVGSATVNVATNNNVGVYGAQIPISINGNFAPINNNTGMELNQLGGFGTFSYNAVIDLTTQGGPNSSTLTAFLSYRGGQIAQASLNH